MIATRLRADGYREVFGLDVGDSKDETFWREFLTTLNDCGLAGVRLVISDAHAGLVKAIGPLLSRRGLVTLPGARDAEPALRRVSQASGVDSRVDPDRVAPPDA